MKQRCSPRTLFSMARLLDPYLRGSSTYLTTSRSTYSPLCNDGQECHLQAQEPKLQILPASVLLRASEIYARLEQAVSDARTSVQAAIGLSSKPRYRESLSCVQRRPKNSRRNASANPGVANLYRSMFSGNKARRNCIPSNNRRHRSSPNHA